jgi:putative tryptophan/tyrosine transport system substrate-binding protein
MASHIERRKFLATVGAAAAWPLAARAQQPTIPVVGFLNGASAWEYAYVVGAFRQGLKETGYVEGQNVAIEYRWAEGHYERLPTLVADLLSRHVTVIAANAPAAVAAKAATTSIPVVFVTAADPVKIGFVASLNRPGGNLTGVALLSVELAPKKLQILHELVPTERTVGLLVNSTNPNAETQSRDLQVAAQSLGLRLHVLHANSESDFDKAFAAMAQLRVGALVIGTDGFLNSRSEQLAALAMRHGMPAIFQYREFTAAGGFQYREFTAAGGLMSYGTSLTDTYRQVGVYVGRILKGEKPADLPVEQATKVELIINLRTARALGLTVPPTLLARADEVIE